MVVPETRAALTFGRYKEPVLIGSGGMGAVYRALDPSLDRAVAIKVLTHREPRYVERFRREAQVLAKIMHPSIIQIYEIVGGDEDAFDPYIVMEYFAGKPLDVLLKDGALPSSQIVSILLQCAEGLKKAHASAVIHRDIKPANLMVSDAGDLKILDFGIAKALDAKKDLTGQTVLGTPYYMSPEQAMGQVIDGRTDIYSLGITAFHLFTGSRPFEAKSKVDVMLAQVKTPLPDMRALVPGADPRFVKLVERMCSKKAADRPQSCAELIEELESLPRSLGGRVADTDSTLASLPAVLAGEAWSGARAAPRPGQGAAGSDPATALLPHAIAAAIQTPSRTAERAAAATQPLTPASARPSSQPGALRPDPRAPAKAISSAARQRLIGVGAGAAAAIAIIAAVALNARRSADATSVWRVPGAGWASPGPPAPALKKIASPGGFGNCVFAGHELGRADEDESVLRRSFAGGENIFGRCYLSHPVGANTAGEVWQELWIDGVKRAQIIYDPPLPTDEDQLALVVGRQHGARLADLKPGKHLIDVWIYMQPDESQPAEALAAGEFTLRK